MDGGVEAEGLLPRCCDGGGWLHVMPVHLFWNKQSAGRELYNARPIYIYDSPGGSGDQSMDPAILWALYYEFLFPRHLSGVLAA